MPLPRAMHIAGCALRGAARPHRSLALLCLLLAVAGCHTQDSTSEREPVARVYEQYLYRDQVDALVPDGTSPSDSINIVQNYIRSWVEQRLLVTLAERNLPEERKNVEKQLEDYRNSLLIFSYEQELVRQKMDTLVTEDQIAEYYKNNKSDFELKDYIVKVRYVKLEQNSPRLNRVRQWMRSDGVEELQQLEDYSHQFAVNYFFDENIWLYFDDLLKEIPIETYNKENLLRTRKWVEFSDDSYLFLLRIKDYRLKNSTSPLS
ncbi:MAG: hypothetical protein AAGB22_08070, partial [Bacteroidota bacterium]